MADFQSPARTRKARLHSARGPLVASLGKPHRLAAATSRYKGRLACVVLACALALPAAGALAARDSHPLLATQASNARIAGRVPFGIGDQDPAIFTDPRFVWLGVRFARVVLPWDSMRHRTDLRRAEWWLNAAHAAGIEALVAFDQSSKHEHLLPTMGSYEGAVRAFMRHFPWVNHYQPWNEENQAAQPTSRSPRRAAEYFNWLSRACHKCTVTATDLLDGSSMEGWLRTFLKYAHGAQIFGLHPYFELHKGGTTQISRLERMVHGQIWLTEAGLPMWRYQRNIRHFSFTSMGEQVTAVKRLLGLVRGSGRITRIYYYQWRAPIPYSRSLSQYHHHHTVEQTWDSGLLNPDCSVRPTFKVVAQALGRSTAHIPRARLSHNHWECLPIPPPRPAVPSTGGSTSASG